VNAERTHAKQLTIGKDDELPVCSADGKSFYYTDNVTYRTMKAPIGGGTAELVKATIVPNGFMIGGVSFSPDGKWLPEIETTTRPDIFNFVAVSPEGKSVAYIVAENGLSSVWSQAIDGSKGHWLTNFTFRSDQHISIFAR